MNNHVILGLWPIAGITSGAVDSADAEATIKAAIDSGIRWFDTAFSYGYEGESDRLLGKCIGSRREQFGIIGKAGQRWTQDRQRVVDCSPKQLLDDCRTSLNRIGIDQFDLFMLHAVDPQVDIRISAEAMAEIKEQGMAKEVGLCNVNASQLEQFCQVLKPHALQHSLNMLQRDTLTDPVPLCIKLEIEVHVYWVLMKGILAGRISREHSFAEGDSRPRYDIYQGDYREKTHRIVEQLAVLAKQESLSVAQLSIGWAISQPGITAALIGAKRPEQIQETAESRPLPSDVLAKIEEICQQTL